MNRKGFITVADKIRRHMREQATLTNIRTLFERNHLQIDELSNYLFHLI